MFGFGRGTDAERFSIEVWKGFSGNTGPFRGTYQEAMAKAYEEKRKGATKVVVKTKGGKVLAEL